MSQHVTWTPTIDISLSKIASTITALQKHFDELEFYNSDLKPFRYLIQF